MSSTYKDSFTYLLKDQTDMIFRTILSEDKAKIRDGFKLLSPKSRYLRFFTYLKELSDKQLEYLSNVDQINHVAWAALDHTQHHDEGVGVGRFIRLENERHSAEVAITVIDSYQGKGIGNILFAIMYIMAKIQGIDFFVGSVLPANHYVIKKMKEMNAMVRYDGNVYQFKIPIYQNIYKLNGSGSLESFKNLLLEIEKRLI